MAVSLREAEQSGRTISGGNCSFGLFSLNLLCSRKFLREVLIQLYDHFEGYFCCCWIEVRYIKVFLIFKSNLTDTNRVDTKTLTMTNTMQWLDYCTTVACIRFVSYLIKWQLTDSKRKKTKMEQGEQEKMRGVFLCYLLLPLLLFNIFQ